MWTLALVVVSAAAAASGYVGGEIRTGEHLVSSVLTNCVDMGCVKENVLVYLDAVLNKDAKTGRKLKNIDAAIFKRMAKIIKTHEFRVTLPEALFDKTEVIYNPKTGLDITAADNEGRGLLKKKLFLPLLLLLKLKMKALLPLFVGLIGIKAFKALILSKLAIVIVLGFVIYQLVTKAGMGMPMSMAPATDPTPMYGAPAPSTPSSYEPGWDANSGGPYSRIWNAGGDSQNIAYSAYYPGPASSSTARP